MGPSQTDSVWIYTITYGGGIVSVCTLSISLHKEMCMVFVCFCLLLIVELSIIVLCFDLRD